MTSTPKTDDATPRTIIPVAGGKGGVGKTFVTASLAIALAKRGRRTVAADLDLGNSNLHSFLGLDNRYPGIGDYLRRQIDKPLEDLLVETAVPGLWFLAGDGRMPFMANLTYNHKRVLLRELRRLPADFLLLDLSAGTSFNTLDFFSMSSSGIVVTTPEYPAIVSSLVFLKNLVLRAIDQELRKDPSVVDLLNQITIQRTDDALFTVREFSKRLAQENPDSYAAVGRLCRRIRPRWVHNMMERLEDLDAFESLDRTLEDILGIGCDHFGLIPHDARVRQSLREPKGLLPGNISARTAESIDRLAMRVIRYWADPIPDSAHLLAAYGRTILSRDSDTAATPPSR